jgi:GT2 family glycosyltransferase
LDVLVANYRNLLNIGILEILVIDNNSKDLTASVSISYQKEFSTIRYIHEIKQGLSNARNRGIAEACGDILVFLDDDVEVAPGWLEGLVEPLESDETIGVVGGRVLPFGQPTPTWIPEKFYWIVGIIDYGTLPKFVSYAPGGNMALRKSIFNELSAFDPSLGRNGSLSLGGEEVELQRRIMQKGLKIYYSPEGLIYHKIADKLNEEYILRFAYHEGISSKRMDCKALKTKFLAKSAFAFIMTRVVLPLRSAFAQTLEISIRQKYLQGYLIRE